MLRHTSPQISFTKAERFKKNLSASQTDFFIPNKKNGRTTNMGYGKKKLMPDHVLTNAKIYPSPNKYNT